ncbi:cytochrome c biogenesis protein CcmG, thiol:disulfide interchange protein DsbE [Limimonas halophila]|uniref:Cytochrome c biogenesis protein CcmG, thiol:disulfide interchange protein DsbE n=1 Tax=Limimonas halophila TaxID=1082479 RepID=A0A1G7RMT2_9PROT|nr:DsbE family thiol:disulfide interchange protein [Limimonas halophila]SDG12003.1 cytochrome c biogenesis protein CcmG, thiol:disulfide interchange protein DsbE [Limimonas halophila]
MSEHGATPPGLGRRLLFALPLLAVLAFAGLAYWGLQPGHDPDAVPTGMVGERIPDFTLPALAGVRGGGVSLATLTAHEGPVLVNVFASWCAPCRAEHPVIMHLAEQRGIPVYGIAYKNAPAKARAWLNELGNPYRAVGVLSEKRAGVGIDLGISGVPETFLVGPNGVIRYKHNGALTRTILENDLLPRLAELRDQ